MVPPLVANDVEGANQILTDGMQAALEKAPKVASESLIYRSLERGLELTAAVQDPIASLFQSPQVTLGFLNAYYRFLNRVIVELETRTPWHDSGSNNQKARDRNEHDDNLFFAYQSLRYVQFELDWLIQEFVKEAGSDGVKPIESGKLFLSIAENIAKFAAADLKQTIWEPRFETTISGLLGLSEKLSRYNAGNLSPYGTEKFAVNSVYREIKNYRNAIALSLPTPHGSNASTGSNRN
jgi:hypothetical protein